MLNEYLAFYYTCQRICHYYSHKQFTSLLQLLDETRLEECNTDQVIAFLHQLREEYALLNYIGNGRFRLLSENDRNFKEFNLQFKLGHKQTISRVVVQIEDGAASIPLKKLITEDFARITKPAFNPVRSSNFTL